MPLPRIVPGELERMPDYVRTHPREDWIDNDAPTDEHHHLFDESARRRVRERLAERLVSCFPASPVAGTALLAKC